VSSPLNVHLEHYEGPLDLLLDLIRKQQINIYDIPIASITAQYLDFMQRALELDIEISAEFVYMAATLIHIKSRMLLPRDPELEKISPEEDPRNELVERLLEHERFKQAAEMLQQKRLIEESVWSNPQIDTFLAADEEPGLAVTLFDLVKTFQQVLDRARDRPAYDASEEDVSVPQMILHVKSLLEETRSAMIAVFLAILEMVKMQAIVLVQKGAFSDIAIKRHRRFAEVFASGEVMAAIERGYS
jgi:segregation and condensation protein A